LRLHHYSSNESTYSLLTNVAVATLRQTVNDQPINLVDIARGAGTIPRVASEILRDMLDHDNIDGSTLDYADRFKIGLIAARLGASDRAASALSWQEFEFFGAKCLALAGFEVQKGVIFNDKHRRWQVDLVGIRDETLLSIDCKHWESPNYPSKFNKATQHQKDSLRPLLNHLRTSRSIRDLEVWGLPVILTLFQPRQPCINEVILVSIGQLPDFLAHVNPFNSELPFIHERQTRKALSADTST
jgi:hypothetical protein